MRSHNDHHRILAALGARNSLRAEALMWEHVTAAGDVLIEHVAPKLTDRDAAFTFHTTDMEQP